MIDASLEAPEGGSLYQDAWSGTATSVAVSGPAGKSNVKTYGVGGDFFLFHPYTLLSGSYIAESDFAQDRVVLDENLAWQLFGSSDVAGMEVTIGERNYPVAGVVRLEDDKATKKALTDPGADVHELRCAERHPGDEVRHLRDRHARPHLRLRAERN